MARRPAPQRRFNEIQVFGPYAVDFYLSETRDREAAKLFLGKALANPDNRTPHVFPFNQILTPHGSST
jgi:hypothetical protein